MKIDTNYFGEVEIDEKDIISFEQGLPGFLDEKAFVLLNFEEPVAFRVMQSVETKDLAFIVVTPFDFKQNYEVNLDDQLLEQLKIESESDVLILALVTLKGTLKESTANLQAPIVINKTERLAKQYIMHQSTYKTKASIFTNTAVEGEQ